MVSFIKANILQVLHDRSLIGITTVRRTFGNAYEFAHAFRRYTDIGIDHGSFQVAIKRVITYDLAVAASDLRSISSAAA